MANGKIMVVDDEKDILDFFTVFLKQKSYEVIVAGSGEEALMKAHIEKPDLIFLDIMMPKMDGWEVLKLLKLDDETARIPVVMLSARTEAKDKVRGLQEGAIDYVCKPFSPRDLLKRIEHIMAEHPA